MTGFWSFIWIVFAVFAFTAYLYVVFGIITDMFRNHNSSGWAKAFWVIFLMIFPIITALVYLIVHGNGMARRAQEAALENQAAANAYIRQAAGHSSPADQIAQAKALLDNGTIDQKEFEHLKAKALA